jgi:glyoxylase-like metal-dependent hydrolase (beta-lactamase superfamily II)
MCPWGARLFPGMFPPVIPCHCLLIEAGDGLVLVDTGFGLRDYREPALLGPSRHVLGVRRDEQATAAARIRALGHDPRDVRHIICTHLDVDHAGGIPEFPGATVHVWTDEFEAAVTRPTAGERSRYRPHQFARHGRWHLHERAYGERWRGFDAVRAIPGLPPELLLLPTPGHTRGHLAVAVDQGERWLLHAGDVYYAPGQLPDRAGRESGPAGMRLFQRIVDVDAARNADNRRALAELMRRDADVEVFCAHDPDALQRLAHADPGPSSAPTPGAEDAP